jgi:hypothetical protein
MVVVFLVMYNTVNKYSNEYGILSLMHGAAAAAAVRNLLSF